jgi:o-succinylbenzoate synthase
VDLLTRTFRIPLRTRFRGINRREGMLLLGPMGWGEFSPFPEYGADIAARWLAAATEAATRPWPAPRRESVPVNATVPAVTPEAAYALVTESGCSAAKVKVAEGDDESRVEAVRQALGPAGKLRLDANAAWTVDEAATTIRRLARYDLEYVEQPVGRLEDMAALRRKVDVPVAADESLRYADDPALLKTMEAADLVVLKVQPLGGVRRAIGTAARCGLPAVVSSALETSIGIAAGLALAAALPELPYACGLNTVTLLEGDVVADPLVARHGEIAVRRPPVDENVLAPFDVEAEAGGRTWQTRLEQARAIHQEDVDDSR